MWFSRGHSQQLANSQPQRKKQRFLWDPNSSPLLASCIHQCCHSVSQPKRLMHLTTAKMALLLSAHRSVAHMGLHYYVQYLQGLANAVKCPSGCGRGIVRFTMLIQCLLRPPTARFVYRLKLKNWPLQLFTRKIIIVLVFAQKALGPNYVRVSRYTVSMAPAPVLKGLILFNEALVCTCTCTTSQLVWAFSAHKVVF